MARIPPSDHDYEKKLNKVNLAKLGRLGLKPTVKEQPLMDAVSEGYLLLAADEKKGTLPATVKLDETKRLNNTLGSTSSNPFIRARIQILNKMSPFDRHEIERMEKTHDLNNRFYEDFVHRVRVLGEEFQEKN